MFIFGLLDMSAFYMKMLPGKKGLEVLIQGGVIDDVGKHLVEQYGVPKRFIEVLDKTARK